MIEIGYNTMDCVGSGTIFGLLQDRISFLIIGIVVGYTIKYWYDDYQNWKKDRKELQG